MAETDAEAFARLMAAAAVHHQAGALEQALQAYRAALALRPGHARALHNLGAIQAQLGEAQPALESFDAAVAAEPRYTLAHYHRGQVLDSLGRRAEAIDAFARALVCDPDHYAAHRAMALCLLAEGKRGRALDHFARTYELRRGDDRQGMAQRSLTSTNRTKLNHDSEQLRFLAQLGREAQPFEMLARRYELAAGQYHIKAHPLSQTDLEQLGESYNTAIHIAEAPEVRGHAVTPLSDQPNILAAFERTGAVCWDDLLTPAAFASLRRYLLRSTIWHDFSHIEGFVAAYLEDGLACPLLLQIVDELRAAFPELLDAHPFSQAWAFKAVEPAGAIEVHADDAAISANFWMTPSSANQNPGQGGLTVCLTPPPRDWLPVDYVSDRLRAVHFLEQNRQNALIVPYKENRVVLFQSRLLHGSDAPIFSEGYENHRISVTLLFGRPRAAGWHLSKG